MPKHTSTDPKMEALRQSGTLNPRPEDVTDELFKASEFFDARDVVQVKYEMLRRVEKEGRPITEAASAFGFSRVHRSIRPSSLSNRMASLALCHTSVDPSKRTS